MNKTTLGFALAIQLAVVGVLLAVRSGDVEAPEPFLDFDAAAVSSFSVADADGEVALAKSGDAWQLPGGIPADASKVDEVLAKLADGDAGWPVASSASTAERFEVTEDNHQRHLILKAGDETIADVYLGTSPGYRKTHARRHDDDDVYAITFSNYEAGAEAGDWLDKTLLRPQGSVASIRRTDGFALAKGDDGAWQAEGGAVLDQGKATTFAGRFTGLTVLGVADAEALGEASATFTLEDDDGAFAFMLYQMAEDDYAAATDRVPGVYEISSYMAEQMDVGIEDLMPDPPEEDAADDAEGEELASGADVEETTEEADDSPPVVADATVANAALPAAEAQEGDGEATSP